MKFFLGVLLFFVIVWLIRGGRRRAPPAAPPPTPVAPSADADAAHESIIACAHCGVHLPQSEAIGGPVRWFCGEAHRIAHDDVAPR